MTMKMIVQKGEPSNMEPTRLPLAFSIDTPFTPITNVPMERAAPPSAVAAMITYFARLKRIVMKAMATAAMMPMIQVMNANGKPIAPRSATTTP